MMNDLEWTDAARSRWEQFLDAKVRAACLDVESAHDLREDLTLHFEEELARENCQMVTKERVHRAVVSLGGDPPVEKAEVESKRKSRSRSLASGAARGFLIMFGVVMPLVVFALEFFTGMCGSTFFAPLGTWIHVVLVAFTVTSNWWLLTKRSHRTPLKWRALAAGASLAVSGFYGLLFVPLLPLSFLALIVFGMGLLSLTPVLNALATWNIARGHREAGNSEWSVWWKRGLLGGILVLLMIESPSVWTRVALSRALSEKDSVAQSGVAQLRFFHREKTLLRACYEGNRGTTMSTDISGWMADGWQLMIPFLWDQPLRDFNSEEVRFIYYRVTGDSFNSQRPPSFITKSSFLGGGRGGDSAGVQWDDHLGGEDVAVRLANLDMVESRMDGHIDASTALAYQEWTMVFRNKNSDAREARMQILLPEDGVVSRVTLWVNGEPQEAAFSSKSKVRAAYQAIAVRQRRDPVLVTTTGPGRVLVQCFPVPADGGEMKIRIGMTSPVKNGQVATPFLLEKNFGVASDLETMVWMQGPKEFSYRNEKTSHPDGEGQSLQLRMPAIRIQKEGAYFESEQEVAKVVWCKDQFAKAGEENLIRRWATEERPSLTKCIVVVDGSESMRSFASEIQKAITEIPDFRNKVTVVIADDGVSQIDLLKHRFKGGRDNGPALEWALTKAREEGNSAVVWLHGPQPLQSNANEALAQLLERGSSEVPLYSVAFKPGGNRLLEKLFQFRSVQMGPRLSNGVGDLEPWLKDLVVGGPEQVAEWSRVADGEAVEGAKVWDQLARWWAAEKVRKGMRQQSAESEAIEFAAKYQLVTAFSGAVVLETAQQYKDHGLEQVDSSTTPNIPASPEPGTWLLLLIGGVASLMRRKRSS